MKILICAQAEVVPPPLSLLFFDNGGGVPVCGTVKDGVIEIQGEHHEKIADTLRKLGYKVKVAGG